MGKRIAIFAGAIIGLLIFVNLFPGVISGSGHALGNELSPYFAIAIFVFVFWWWFNKLRGGGGGRGRRR